MKSISQADEIRTVFNKIIYRKKRKWVLCFYFKGLSLISHSNYSCYGTLSLCSIGKYSEPGAKKSPWALAEMFSPTLAPQNPYCSAKWWERKKKYKFLSDTQLTAAGSHWRDFRCHVPANRTGYWLRCVLGRSSWAPFFPPISCFSLGASHAFIELYNFLWRRKVLHNRIWISGITGKVFLRGYIL